MKLEDKIHQWINFALESELVSEEEHYDFDLNVRYVQNDTRMRMVVSSRIIMYTCDGFEHITCTFAMDHPDQAIIVAAIQDAMDWLRSNAQGAASLREVEDILEQLDEDDDGD